MSSIVDIMDPGVARRSAQRADPVGQMARCVLDAADPDAVFQDLARQLIGGYEHKTRREKITALAKAFGVERLRLKHYLRAHMVCGPKD